MCFLRLVLNEAREGLFLIFIFSLFQLSQWTPGFNIILSKFSISWGYMEVIRLSGIIVMDISLGGEMIIW